MLFHQVYKTSTARSFKRLRTPLLLIDRSSIHPLPGREILDILVFLSTFLVREFQGTKQHALGKKSFRQLFLASRKVRDCLLAQLVTHRKLEVFV